jgi:hypothetical protein
VVSPVGAGAGAEAGGCGAETGGAGGCGADCVVGGLSSMIALRKRGPRRGPCGRGGRAWLLLAARGWNTGWAEAVSTGTDKPKGSARAASNTAVPRRDEWIEDEADRTDDVKRARHDRGRDGPDRGADQRDAHGLADADAERVKQRLAHGLWDAEPVAVAL